MSFGIVPIVDISVNKKITWNFIFLRQSCD